LLDYSIEVVPVPRTYVGPILGSGQRHIQHIVDRIGLSGMRISGALAPDVPDFVAFHLTGTRRAIADAKMFLEFHIASLRELDELRGVKSPPLAPPTTEVARDGDAGSEQEHSAPVHPATGGKQKKRAGRASQQNRRRVPSHQTSDIGNGDGTLESGDEANRDSGPETDHSEQRAGRPSHPENFNAGNSRPPVNSRQRRAQYMQSNNSALSNNRDPRENGVQQKKGQVNSSNSATPTEPYMNGTAGPKSASFRQQPAREHNQTSRAQPSAAVVGTTAT
uniref:KH_dom_type_1 domain-containing protein n=1 Tax=Echinostoma caproni TaxID=27848 RepID=A0A183AC60_9TREM